MKPNTTEKQYNLFGVLKPYAFSVVVLVMLTIIANALSLSVPKIIAGAIDSYGVGGFVIKSVIIKFSIIAALIFIFTYLQNISQVYVSERVARDLRNQLS